MTPELKLELSHARISHLHRMAYASRLTAAQHRVRRHLVLSQRAALRLRQQVTAAGGRLP